MPVSKIADFKLKQIDLTDNTTVAHAPSSNTQTLQPPAGKIYEIVRIFYLAGDPAGSSAGTHSLTVTYDTTYTTYFGILYMSSTTGNDLATYFSLLVGNSAEAPASDTIQAQLNNGVGQLLASHDYPISFIYTNSTDVDQTGTRRLVILVKEYDEVQ
jgi:hypothetical protein